MEINRARRELLKCATDEATRARLADWWTEHAKVLCCSYSLTNELLRNASNEQIEDMRTYHRRSTLRKIGEELSKMADFDMANPDRFVQTETIRVFVLDASDKENPIKLPD